MERPILRHGANTRERDLMANIAEMVKELQQQRDRLDQASAKSQPNIVNPGKRTMSAAARRKIAASQPARWALRAKQKKAA
jgi:hypothetical protein